MAKKTSEEILEGMKKATEKATDMIGDAAAVVADAAKPVVSKAKKAAAPTVKKAVKAGSDAAQAVVETTKKVTPKKPEYYVQFAGKEIDMEDLANQAKASFEGGAQAHRRHVLPRLSEAGRRRRLLCHQRHLFRPHRPVKNSRTRRAPAVQVPAGSAMGDAPLRYLDLLCELSAPERREVKRDGIEFRLFS